MRLMISVRCGLPASTCVNRASFIAVSIASDPDWQKNTRASAIGTMSTSFSASSSAGALVNGSKHE